MTQETVNLINLLLDVVFGGGIVGFWLRYKIQKRGADKIDFDSLLAAMKDQRDEAWAHIERQDARIENLEAEIQGLRIARDLDPFPQWLVDLDGRYTFVNRPFEERFLEPKRQTFRDIIGKTHKDFWPEEFCRTLEALDGAARKRPDGTARANTALDVPCLGRCEVTVHKFPCRIKGVVVAYAGYITSIEPELAPIGLPEKSA